MALKVSSPRSEANIITRKRSNDGQLHEQSAHADPLHAASQDIIHAVIQGDAVHLSNAIRAAFQILDREPHQEGPHTEDGDQE